MSGGKIRDPRAEAKQGVSRLALVASVLRVSVRLRRAACDQLFCKSNLPEHHRLEGPIDYTRVHAGLPNRNTGRATLMLDHFTRREIPVSVRTSQAWLRRFN